MPWTPDGSRSKRSGLDEWTAYQRTLGAVKSGSCGYYRWQYLMHSNNIYQKQMFKYLSSFFYMLINNSL